MTLFEAWDAKCRANARQLIIAAALFEDARGARIVLRNDKGDFLHVKCIVTSEQLSEQKFAVVDAPSLGLPQVVYPHPRSDFEDTGQDVIVDLKTLAWVDSDRPEKLDKVVVTGDELREAFRAYDNTRRIEDLKKAVGQATATISLDVFQKS